MTENTRRYDLSDSVWALLEAHLPGQSGQWGALAGLVRKLRRLEEHAPQILSLAGPGCLGGTARTAH